MAPGDVQRWTRRLSPSKRPRNPSITMGRVLPCFVSPVGTRQPHAAESLLLSSSSSPSVPVSLTSEPSGSEVTSSSTGDLPPTPGAPAAPPPTFGCPPWPPAPPVGGRSRSPVFQSMLWTTVPCTSLNARLTWPFSMSPATSPTHCPPLYRRSLTTLPPLMTTKMFSGFPSRVMSSTGLPLAITISAYFPFSRVPTSSCQPRSSAPSLVPA